MATPPFLTACLSTATATESPAAVPVEVEAKATLTLIVGPIAPVTFTPIPTEQPREKDFDYTITYADSDFKIREAFLGAEDTWNWDNFAVPKARIRLQKSVSRFVEPERNADNWYTMTVEIPLASRLGLLHTRVVVIVQTETEDMIRIISVRKATKNEEANYYQEIAD